MKRLTPRHVLLAASVLVLPAAALLRRPADVPGLAVRDGLEASVFAESPMLTNPTDLDVDARGRVWVLEGYNYRTQLHPNQPVKPEGDRVLILEDTDGDGRADRSKVFYQGRDVDAAMGIAVLGDKVIVSSYENVFVFTDADGDDVPERKEVLFKFGKQNHDHTVHAFVFGPDGRLYFNVGNASEFVADPQGNVIVDRAGNRVAMDGKPYREGLVFRTNLDRSGFETLGQNFRNPYEVALDSYGTVWQTDNDDDGNRSVRVNFVMEYGNYGYKDEATGASWPAYRTGLEEEIPRRHWHQADPGVVPNVLITGAGAPSGLLVYEGQLLPEPFRNAMIHADAGAGEVRAYPVQPDGAGYGARMESILKGAGDALFRPVDVAAAPDGSLFVADWYDPGVGGHNVQDLTHGRILRVAPSGVPYRASAAPDLSTPERAVRALESPNHATRYLAYQKLAGWKGKAAGALRQEWRSANPRFRARALWLLSALPGEGERWIAAGLKDADPDLRITALRAARRGGSGVLGAAQRLVHDPSPAVRREVAIALRGQTGPGATALWVELAKQYDGRDRWYLEALGIGADGQWDRFLGAWFSLVGDAWNTPSGRDIVWRARSPLAASLLGALIRDPGTPRDHRLRYFRAFDFQTGPARQQALLSVLEGGPGDPETTAQVLEHLDTAGVRRDPRIRAALAGTLDAVRGTDQYVELARKYDARERADELLALALAHPDGSAGVEAGRLVMRWRGLDPFRRLVDGQDGDAAARALTLLGNAGGGEAERFLEQVAFDPGRSMPLRTTAIQVWGPSWNGGNRLVALAREGRIPAELKPAVAQVLISSWRGSVHDAGVEFFGAPRLTTADGRTLPGPDVLAQRTGDPARGRAAFQKACAACHAAQGAGTDFGPDLSAIGTKFGKEALYAAVLHPSAGIAFGYEGTVLRLRDGSEVPGIVTSETADEVTLKRVGGVATRYRKAEIASRARMERSLMPEGLAGTLREQELVDLVEYLASLGRAAR